jgi:hypothetical protein
MPSSQRLTREQTAARQAKQLLGLYRKTDAINPEIYIPAIACVLAAYEEKIIFEATHPRVGIAGTEKFKGYPPNPGELKEFCENLVIRGARYAHYSALPKPDLTPRLPPLPDNTPGRRANLFVSDHAPHYEAMVERSKISDPLDWCWFTDHPKFGNGIKVPLDWYPNRYNSNSGGFQKASAVPTDEELQRRYGRRKAS